MTLLNDLNAEDAVPDSDPRAPIQSTDPKESEVLDTTTVNDDESDDEDGEDDDGSHYVCYIFLVLRH
jgi:hypothetical protein